MSTAAPRDALPQLAAAWKTTLRSEPKVARLLLRRLIGPLALYDESTRPDFIQAGAEVKPGFDGLRKYKDVASPTGNHPFTVTGSVLRHGRSYPPGI